MKTPKTKICTKCGRRLLTTVEYFYRDRSRKDGLQRQCKGCQGAMKAGWQKNNRNRHNERARIWSKQNREKCNAAKRKYRKKHPDRCRAAKRRYTHGITNEEYVRLLKQQNGVCAICHQPETMVRGGRVQHLSVDHSHATGEVRGLLCVGCNTALGSMKDNEEHLLAAVEYLKNY